MIWGNEYRLSIQEAASAFKILEEDTGRFC